ncbi:Uncharacterised protein [Klebsiella pneumoniae]|nr:Uncharacterised protein [Klebsiella pneumoniae]
MKLALLRAIALITPARIASGATPAERRLIASDSANTVHILVMACGVTFSVMLSSCSTLVPSVREITSRKRPVPAAHLSFIRKSHRLPSSSS